MFNMHLFVFIVIITICACSSQKATEEDRCRALGHEVEYRMRVFMFMNKEPIIPTNDTMLQRYCDEIRSLPKNVKDYRKCVDPFSKQVISIVLPNLIKSVKRVCVTHKELTINNMRCATKVQQSHYQKCFNDFSVRTKYMAYKLADPNQLLSQMCCSFHVLRKCLNDRVQSNKCKSPNANLAKYLNDYAQALGQEVVSFSCAKYQDIGICEKQKVVEIISKYQESDVKEFSDEFILIPLIKGTQNVVRT